ncbi:MAG: ABC transporter permease [Deltaproteobacteria bacterium]|nr:ABC transporter permease [Deltaproteobacteria bacterium]
MLTGKILARSAKRHPLRTLLTVFAVAVAVLAFGLLRTVVDAWYLGVKASSASRLVTRNAISLMFPLPLAYKEKIRQISGVTRVSQGHWFGGIYIDERNFFANFAVDAPSYLALYPEILLSDAERAAFLRERTACIAGRKTVERFGWRLGHRITLKGTVFPGNWEVVLRGIYRGKEKTTDETVLFFHWDYLNEELRRTAPGRADQVGYYMVGVARPDQAAEVAQAIDATFRNSLAETLTESEKAFVMSFITMSEAILWAIQLLSAAMIAIIMVVAANTMAMAARERIGEYAIMKTLGFGAWRIASLVFGESLLLSVLGGALGIPLTYAAARFFETKLGQFFPVFQVSSATLLLDAAAIVLVGVVAGVFPFWRAVKIPIADGLRRIG